MISISSLIYQNRKNIGLTQAELSCLAKISIPNLQKIEAGRGNPSHSTLSALLLALGLQMEIKPILADWDILAACGAPLVTTGKNKTPPPTPELLLSSLRSACHELQNSQEIIETRKLEAVQALLLGIRAHFPKFFKLYIQPSPLLLSFFPTHLTGRIIKLKRQTLNLLSKYL